ncbi:MAG: PilZ domain-containing protein [Planctomycetota bacterium]
MPDEPVDQQKQAETASAPGDTDYAGPAADSHADDLIDVAAGVKTVDDLDTEKRRQERHPYEGLVAIVLLASDGERSRPVVVRAKDISVGGICVVSRQMLHPDSRGAIQMVRSDGTRALVGVQVRFCRYAGAMRHETGMEFTALPEGLTAEDFVDESGQMVVLDPLLNQNRLCA